MYKFVDNFNQAFMNNEQVEQIKQRISLLTEAKKRFESFTLPLATGVIISLVSKEYLGKFLYICLAIGGMAIVIFFELKIERLKKRISSLINQLYES